MKKLLGIYENMDKTEGRGPTLLTALANDAGIAEDKGCFGRPAEIKEVIVWDSAEEYLAHKQSDLRQRALNKLSRAEAEALGVKF